MIITVDRFNPGESSTIGNLYVGEGMGRYWFCHTLENAKRAVKIVNETRIPAGEYEIKMRHGSPKFGKYDQRFAGHNGMMHLQNVEDFTYVYIHCGNSHRDTSGCLLVGDTHSGDDIRGGGSIGRSTKAYKRLYSKIQQALLSGEEVIIKINDEGF